MALRRPLSCTCVRQQPIRLRSYATLVGALSISPGKQPKAPQLPPNFFNPHAFSPPRSPPTREFAKDEDILGRLSTVGGEKSDPLESYIIRCVSKLDWDQVPSWSQLLQQADQVRGLQLQQTLHYESTPTPERRLALDTLPAWSDARSLAQMSTMSENVGSTVGDGVVLVAHVQVDDNRKLTMNISHGTGIKSALPTASADAQSSSQEQLIATCLHPLTHLRPTPPSSRSTTLVMSSTGGIFEVSGVGTSLSESDLIVLRLGKQVAGPTGAQVGSVPINPYPLAVGRQVWVHHLVEARDGHQNRKRWEAAEIMEYKDDMGLVAKTGTYDSLSSFTFTSRPSPGDSGGPIICQSTGSLVGWVRGTRASYGDPQTRGFACVAERLWEGFRLPGLKLASEKRKQSEFVEAGDSTVKR